MQWADRIGRRIKLRDLHVLHAVVQAGSMTKAAGQLAISVPVVSKAIADLEHTVGVPLLDRSPQGVEPTAYGRALLRRSLVAFDELRQGVKDIEFLADPTIGEVRIASTAPLAASFVSGVIDRLSRRYPRIVLYPTVAEGTEILRRDLERAQRRPPDRPADSAPLADERAGASNASSTARTSWWRARTIPGFKRRRIALADLMDEPWVLPPPDSPVRIVCRRKSFRAAGARFSRARPWSRLPTRCASVCWRPAAISRSSLNSCCGFPARSPASGSCRSNLPLRRMPIGIVTVKEPHAQPRRAALHRCRPRGREAAGGEKGVEATSAPALFGQRPHQIGEVRSQRRAETLITRSDVARLT